jgi:DNA-directed RNA polymerase specialized sigma24 family protein
LRGCHELKTLIVNLPARSKRDRSLTSEAFDLLLLAFDADREAAGQKYEIMRRKLSEFFEARGGDAPPDHADETINRVARRISEGEEIQDLKSYFYGVARLVWLEALRSGDKQLTPLELAPTPIAANTEELEVERQQREDCLTCLETCLAQLSAPNRTLIIEYYQEEKGLKIEHRKRQAEKLNTTLNGLRLRASRIRSELTQCVHSCVEQGRQT